MGRGIRTRRLAGGALAVAALTVPAGSETDRRAPLAVEHVTVVPMDAPRHLRDHTVIIVDDRISQVGPSSVVRVPARARRIAGRGRFLMPALADLHVHIGPDADFLLYVANGVTVVRNMNGTPDHLRWRDEIRRGARLGPDIYTTGPTIYSQPADADAIVADQKRDGYDFVKLYHFVPIDGYRAVLAAARRHGMRVVGHRPSRVTSADAVRMGMESLEHLLGYAIELERRPSPLGQALARGQYSFRYTYAGVTIDESRLRAVADDMRRAGAGSVPRSWSWTGGRRAPALAPCSPRLTCPTSRPPISGAGRTGTRQNSRQIGLTVCSSNSAPAGLRLTDSVSGRERKPRGLFDAAAAACQRRASTRRTQMNHLVTALVFATTIAQSGQPGPGPAVGSRAPDFEANDQDGRTRSLTSLLGPNGALLVFYRSADW